MQPDIYQVGACLRPVPAGELHAWVVPLDDELAHADDCFDVLDRSERERAGRYAFVPLRYLAAHAALRGILGHALGLAPEEVALETGVNGKPRLAPGMPALFFNLSHSNEVAVVALSSHEGVGIDIERCTPVRELLPLVRRHFTRIEQDAFWAMGENERLAGFYRWWTCKEACLKATGLGLSYPLDAFSVEFRPGFPPCVLEATIPLRLPLITRFLRLLAGSRSRRCPDGQFLVNFVDANLLLVRLFSANGSAGYCCITRLGPQMPDFGT